MGKKMLNQLLWTINFMRSLEIPRSDVLLDIFFIDLIKVGPQCGSEKCFS